MNTAPNGDTPNEERRRGNVLVRMPASLHGDLIRAATDDGVSVNHYICCALAAAVRWKATSANAEMGAEALREAKRRAREAAVWEGWQRMFRD